MATKDIIKMAHNTRSYKDAAMERDQFLTIAKINLSAKRRKTKKAESLEI